MSNDLRLTGDTETDGDRMIDAVDLAAAQDETTYLLDPDGRRVAAIVPVEAAQEYERRFDDVLRSPAGPRTTICNLCGHPSRAHRTPGGSGGSRWPLDELDCSGCDAGKCRTPKGRHENSLVIAARSSMRYRRGR